MRFTIEPIRTVGLLLSPTVLSLVMLQHDRESGYVSPDTQKPIDLGQFYALAQKFELPGLTKDRVSETLDYIQEQYPNNEVCQLRSFSGDLTSLIQPDADLNIADFICDDMLYYMSPSRKIDWFQSDYETPEHLIREFKARIGRRWPANFPWATHIAEIYGIYHV